MTGAAFGRLAGLRRTARASWVARDVGSARRGWRVTWAARAWRAQVAQLTHHTDVVYALLCEDNWRHHHDVCEWVENGRRGRTRGLTVGPPPPHQ